MTAYLVTDLASSGYRSLAINAGLYEVKIERVDFIFSLPASASVSILAPMYRSTGHITGGTSGAATIVPMRHAGPAASATAISGSSMTIGGTSVFVAYVSFVGTSQTVVSTGGPTYSEPSGGSTSYTSPVDLTIAPGGSFRIDDLYGPDSNGFTYTATVYFEELRPPWSY
jgi:hypothetical protein